MNTKEVVRLTQFSHGAGCGCKISPKILEKLIKPGIPGLSDPRILVGNDTNDDAAVVDLGDGRALVSTTDFFMPIVDDPFDFGAIAATNAISDIYAMGGTPIVAIAILGWPINELDPEIAGIVLDGARQACAGAGITLAGGHSIDNKEPLFGLAVTGIVDQKQLKRNDQAREGSLLYLTKALGVGIITTAQKKGIVEPQDINKAIQSMKTLNVLGHEISNLPYVNAMTDITGFGLLGHLVEMCEGSNLSAILDFAAIPLLTDLKPYILNGAVPGGTARNLESFGPKVAPASDEIHAILADPQTSGGLLISIDDDSMDSFEKEVQNRGYDLKPIGRLVEKGPFEVAFS